MSSDQQPSPISPADRPNLDVMPAAEEMDDGEGAEADGDVEAEVEAEEAPEQEVDDQGREGRDRGVPVADGDDETQLGEGIRNADLNPMPWAAHACSASSA